MPTRPKVTVVGVATLDFVPLGETAPQQEQRASEVEIALRVSAVVMYTLKPITCTA